MTPEKRLQYACSKLSIASRMAKEAQAEIRAAMKQIEAQKAAKAYCHCGPRRDSNGLERKRVPHNGRSYDEHQVLTKP